MKDNIYRMLLERGNSIFSAKVIAENEEDAIKIGEEYYRKHGIFGLTSAIKGEVSPQDEAMAEVYKKEYDELKKNGGSSDSLKRAASEVDRYLPINDEWFEGKV